MHIMYVNDEYAPGVINIHNDPRNGASISVIGRTNKVLEGMLYNSQIRAILDNIPIVITGKKEPNLVRDELDDYGEYTFEFIEPQEYTIIHP